MRLGEAERLCDLSLRAFEEEPLEDDPSLARIERAGRPGDERAIEAQFFERRRRVERIIVLECQRPVGRLGDATRRRSEFRTGDLALKRPGHPDGSCTIAKVTTQLAFDTPADVGRQGLESLRIAAVDGLDDGQGSHLSEVVGSLRRRREAASKAPRQRQVPLDEA